MSLLDAGDRPPWPWQEAAWRRLCRQRQQQSLAHAYLFCGDSGTGSAGFIHEFANLLLCESPMDQRACRQCRSCRAGGAEHHPDLLQVAPEEGKKDIGIGQIRELTEFLSRSGFSGLARIAMIPQAERLTLAAANALLKTLEEPADRTFLLLAAVSPGRLLPTIRSRCQILPLPGPDPASAADWLRQQVGRQQAQLSGKALHELLEACGNRPLEALAALRSGKQEGLAAMRRCLHGLLSGETGIHKVVTDVGKIGEAAVFEQLSIISTIVIRGLIEDAWQNPENRSLAEALSGEDRAARLAALLEFHRQVTEARKLLAGPGNPNPQLLLESVLLCWQRQGGEQASSHPQRQERNHAAAAGQGASPAYRQS